MDRRRHREDQETKVTGASQRRGIKLMVSLVVLLLLHIFELYGSKYQYNEHSGFLHGGSCLWLGPSTPYLRPWTLWVGYGLIASGLGEGCEFEVENSEV